MRRTKLMAVVAALALGCMAGLALADNARDNKDKGNKENNTKDQTLSDREFAQTASAANLAEIDLGMLAARKGAAPGVREFGNTLVRDHTQFNQKLNQVLDKLRIPAARTATAKQRMLVTKLAGLNGAAFDKEFIHHEMTDHEKAVKMFEQFSRNGKNEQLRTAAKDALPVLRKHVKMAKDLHNKSKESASR
jgi:putative membrane protein